MSGTLQFAGQTAASFGLRIGGVDSYKAPGNIIGTARVPGRVGDLPLFRDEKDVSNEIRQYAAALYMRAATPANVARQIAEIRAWLLNRSGFSTLTDSYEPDFYRRAYFTGDVVPARKGAGQNFEVPLTFACDPRRYIANAPDTVMDQGAAGGLWYVIAPPEAWASLIVYPAAPLIKFEGFYQNDETTLTFTDPTYTEEIGKIVFAENIGTVYFDCETLNATSQPYGGGNLNPWIIDVTGNVTLTGLVDYIKRDNLDARITVTPRWWVR